MSASQSSAERVAPRAEQRRHGVRRERGERVGPRRVDAAVERQRAARPRCARAAARATSAARRQVALRQRGELGVAAGERGRPRARRTRQAAAREVVVDLGRAPRRVASAAAAVAAPSASTDASACAPRGERFDLGEERVGLRASMPGLPLRSVTLPCVCDDVLEQLTTAVAVGRLAGTMPSPLKRVSAKTSWWRRRRRPRSRSRPSCRGRRACAWPPRADRRRRWRRAEAIAATRSELVGFLKQRVAHFTASSMSWTRMRPSLSGRAARASWRRRRRRASASRARPTISDRARAGARMSKPSRRLT